MQERGSCIPRRPQPVMGARLGGSGQRFWHRQTRCQVRNLVLVTPKDLRSLFAIRAVTERNCRISRIEDVGPTTCKNGPDRSDPGSDVVRSRAVGAEQSGVSSSSCISVGHTATQAWVWKLNVGSICHRAADKSTQPGFPRQVRWRGSGSRSSSRRTIPKRKE